MRLWVLGLLVAATLQAADVDVGQRIYLQMMSQVVQESADLFAARHTRAEWQKLLTDDGSAFVGQMCEQFPQLEAYLRSERFEIHLPHLRAYLLEWASDSGNFKGCCVG